MEAYFVSSDVEPVYGSLPLKLLGYTIQNTTYKWIDEDFKYHEWVDSPMGYCEIY